MIIGPHPHIQRLSPKLHICRLLDAQRAREEHIQQRRAHELVAHLDYSQYVGHAGGVDGLLVLDMDAEGLGRAGDAGGDDILDTP